MTKTTDMTDSEYRSFLNTLRNFRMYLIRLAKSLPNKEMERRVLHDYDFKSYVDKLDPDNYLCVSSTEEAQLAWINGSQRYNDIIWR